MRIDLNRQWNFKFNKDSESELVDIPHSVSVTPLNCFDEGIYQTIAEYSKEVVFDASFKSQAVILHFAGVAHKASVFVNDKPVCTHESGYTSFEADISDCIDWDAGNKADIKVLVDSNETLNQPPFGNVIDYMTYGGIYREVWIDIKDKEYIENVYHRFERISDTSGRLVSRLNLSSAAKGDYKVRIKITDKEGKCVLDENHDTLSFETASESGIEFSCELKDITLWCPENPALYTVETQLLKNDSVVDIKLTTTGFRTVLWNAEGFFLNGKKIKLRGLNRHQSYPYVGYAMPESMQKRDAVICKNELGCNVIRTSHYPQSHGFTQTCDEIGLLVVTEIPGWQHIGDSEWKDKAVNNVYEMMTQYRNHPSIILWGVRINESQDDDEFYERTNKLAHELCPGEFTGGVRFLTKSHLLEDVYTYNDFLHNGKTKGCSPKKAVTTDMSKGYMISEHNGHMFPTKSYDSEEHRTEQFIRHATVLNEAYKQEDIGGVIGWCMFDYNTHKDFGSGDRICYHGVMDSFRNPKLAAYLYESQQDDHLVFEVLSSMDIGEHPAGSMKECYVATNADSVKLYKNKKFIKEFFPDKERFSNILHPPVIIDDFIGELIEKEEGYSKKLSENVKKLLYYVRDYGQSNLPIKAMLLAARMMAFDHMTFAKGTELFGKYIGGWGDKVKEYEFVAIKDGKEVKKVIKTPSTEAKLVADVDTHELKEGITYDVSAVRLKAIDQNDNLLSFCNDPVSFETEGDIELIGPKVASLMGGMSGTYVRSLRKGSGLLKIHFRDQIIEVDYRIN